MSIQNLLFEAVEKRILRPLDIQFAMMIANDHEPAVMLAAALLSRDTGKGHICLPLNRLIKDNKMPVVLQDCFEMIGDINWSKTLMLSNAISDGSNIITPLILSNQRLYLHRMWHNERLIARFFSDNYSLPYDKVILINKLNEFFDKQELINWQKVAVAVALTRRISIISGGPGTGKTTTITKLIAVLMHMVGMRKYRIILTAPTRKAAALLTKSMSLSLKYLQLTKEQLKYWPKEAITLHRLLGIQPDNSNLRYHVSNKLHVDLLVVDEASMIDINMMSRLINALPTQARIIFLGDRDQLASVEAGAVLGDICFYANRGYTLARAYELEQLTGCHIEGNSSQIAATLRDSLCILKKNYRFNIDSDISKLASAVKQGDLCAIKTIFNSNLSDIRKIILRTSENYMQMLEEIVEGYLSFLQCVQRYKDPEKALSAFSQFQLLCVLKEGPFGVSGLNDRLEQILFKKHNINRQQCSPWYEGRPVMISINASSLGMFNGDIGIAFDRKQQGLRVWFQRSDGIVKSVKPSRLPKHETAWAITVHKSQGSEFNHVALLLPWQSTSEVLTRELVYTAITRSRKLLSLYTADSVLTQAILNKTERRSGLHSIFEEI